VGSWNVVLASGTRAGTNRIEKTLAGCAVLEHWKDVTGNEGKSLFYYHRVQKLWKQVWVTDAGPIKEKRLVQPPSPDSVRFQGEIPLPDGRTILDRTTLTRLPDGRVRQVIEQSTDNGTTWRVGFDAFYARSK
jgi:hypothetical protein